MILDTYASYEAGWITSIFDKTEVYFVCLSLHAVIASSQCRHFINVTSECRQIVMTSSQCCQSVTFSSEVKTGPKRPKPFLFTLKLAEAQSTKFT